MLGCYPRPIYAYKICLFLPDMLANDFRVWYTACISACMVWSIQMLKLKVRTRLRSKRPEKLGLVFGYMQFPSARTVLYNLLRRGRSISRRQIVPELFVVKGWFKCVSKLRNHA